MDFQDLFQLIPVILFLLFALIGGARRRKRQRSEPDVVLDEEEMTLPPWESEPIEEDTSVSTSAPEVVPKPAPRRPISVRPTEQVLAREVRDRRARTAMREPQPSSDQPPTIAGIPLTPETFRQGIILHEILQRPKALRRPPPE